MGSTKREVDAQFRDAGLPEDWKKHTLDEEPRHLQTVEAFYIYKYEVTNDQSKAFIAATGQKPPPYRRDRSTLCGFTTTGTGASTTVAATWVTTVSTVSTTPDGS